MLQSFDGPDAPWTRRANDLGLSLSKAETARPGWDERLRTDEEDGEHAVWARNEWATTERFGHPSGEGSGV